MTENSYFEDAFENIPEEAEDVESPISTGALKIDLMLKPDQIENSYKRGLGRNIKHPETGSLSRLFTSSRIKKEMTVEILSNKSKVNIEDIIDLELRQLHFGRAKSISKKLMPILDINKDQYKAAYDKDKYNLSVRNRQK